MANRLIDSATFDRTIAVIAVNYRSPADTIECLHSLFSGDRIPYVIVADNDSQDGSIDTITEWAEGKRSAGVAHPFHLESVKRPVSFPIEYEIRRPGELNRPVEKPLTIIDTGANLGFAGGNNRGLQIALPNRDIDTFWLLNNDTTVGPKTVSTVKETFERNPDWGMAGTPIRFYHEPEQYQLLNGMRFNKWTGAAGGIGAGEHVGIPFDVDDVAGQTDFVCGASLIMSREFVEDVGFLEERFFLYYEEIDLATRGNRHRIGFVPDAIVYHKEGASAGSASKLSKRARSPLSEYHHIRSKMLFASKHYPWLLPLYFAQNLAIIARRVLRRQPAQVRATVRATFGRPLG